MPTAGFPTDARDLALADLSDETAALRNERDAALDLCETYRQVACEALAQNHALTVKLRALTARCREQDRQLRDLFGVSARKEAA